MKSYSSQKTNLVALLNEAKSLYNMHRDGASVRVKNAITELVDLEKHLKNKYGFSLQNRDVLDVGVGQFLPQAHYFSINNRVTGIDLDVIAQGSNPLQFVRMLFSNGPRRTAKTIIRKLIGIDKIYRKELKEKLCVRDLPHIKVIRMDCSSLDFGDSSFDFVHSFSVLHSLPNPIAAVDGFVRILRPGGIAAISLHLYTSESGSLDPRAFTNRRNEIEDWKHLRSEYAGLVKPNAYVNKLRLHEWQKLFDKSMPDSEFILTPSRRKGIEDDLCSLISNGELKDYSKEELLTHRIQVLWQKPKEA